MADLCTDNSLPSKDEMKISTCCTGICTLWSSKALFVVGVLILISGICFMYNYKMQCKSVQQTHVYNASILPSSEPLKRTHRLDVLARCSWCNITYFKDALNQGLSDLLQIASQVEKSLSTYPYYNEVKMLHQELMLILHNHENTIQTHIEDLRKLQESLIPKQRKRPPVEK